MNNLSSDLVLPIKGRITWLGSAMLTEGFFVGWSQGEKNKTTKYPKNDKLKTMTIKSEEKNIALHWNPFLSFSDS